MEGVAKPVPPSSISQSLSSKENPKNYLPELNSVFTRSSYHLAMQYNKAPSDQVASVSIYYCSKVYGTTGKSDLSLAHLYICGQLGVG